MRRSRGRGGRLLRIGDDIRVCSVIVLYGGLYASGRRIGWMYGWTDDVWNG